MNASKAREQANAYYNKLVSAHDKEYKKMKADEQHKIDTLKKNGRWDEIIYEIDTHVQRAAAEGKRDLSHLKYMAFYLKGDDTVLFQDLKTHYEDQGYDIKEYADFGLQLQW